MILRQMFFCLFLLFSLLSTPGLTRAENPKTLIVRSEYHSPIPGQGNSIIWWRFAPQGSESGVSEVLVTDLNDRVETRVELYYDHKNSLVQVDCYRQRRGEEVCDARIYDATAPVLMTQSLVPGDWLNRGLPFVPKTDVSEFLVKTKIGTTVFSSHLLVTDAETDMNDARSLGMINLDNEILVHGKKLYLVTVRRNLGLSQDTVVLRQLWVSGDDFWIFEERGNRRSWRVSQE